jgi:hypothetical protein
MRSAVDIDLAASAVAYSQFHADWSQKVRVEAKALAAIKADLILADIPYLTLAGAEKASIPAVALCSINWADIYWHYCTNQPDAKFIHQQIQAAYQSARYFLQPAPSMPMTDLDNALSIGALAALGTPCRSVINQKLQLNPEQRLVCFALGGIEMSLPIQDWPKIEGVSMRVPAAWQIDRPNTFAWESLNLAFIDILCSCDVLITKPGYGTFTEAACHGIPVIYLERDDWPETFYLVDWLKKQTRTVSISRNSLERGAIMESLEQVFAATLLPSPPKANGAEEAADLLLSFW